MSEFPQAVRDEAMTQPDIDKLAAAHAAATAGEWLIYPQTIEAEQTGGRAANAKAELALQVDCTNPIGDTLYLLAAGDSCPATTECGPTSEANAHFIALAHNELPGLLAELRQLRAERDALRIGSLSYDQLFKAIAAATTAQRGGAVEISVAAFRAALGGEHE